MTASEVLDAARAAGIKLLATPEGKLRWRSAGELPADLQQQLREHKGELLAMLARAGEAQKPKAFGPTPPPFAKFFAEAADSPYRPCPIDSPDVGLWTWEGASQWYAADVFPPPVGTSVKER